jgi:hypothetical protein
MLVSTAVILLLASLTIVGVNSASQKAKSAVCIGNLRQLQAAYLIYVGDFDSALPNNRANEEPGGSWRSEPLSWVGPSNVNLPNDSDNMRIGVIFPYLKTTAIYHCPLDKSRIGGKSAPRKARYRERSYSMNGSLNGRTNGFQKVITRLGQALHPTDTFCLIQESADTLDDGHFFVNQVNPGDSTSAPSGIDRRRTSITFLDGHAELTVAKDNQELIPFGMP